MAVNVFICETDLIQFEDGVDVIVDCSAVGDLHLTIYIKLLLQTVNDIIET